MGLLYSCWSEGDDGELDSGYAHPEPAPPLGMVRGHYRRGVVVDGTILKCPYQGWIFRAPAPQLAESSPGMAMTMSEEGEEVEVPASRVGYWRSPGTVVGANEAKIVPELGYRHQDYALKAIWRVEGDPQTFVILGAYQAPHEGYWLRVVRAGKLVKVALRGSAIDGAFLSMEDCPLGGVVRLRGRPGARWREYAPPSAWGVSDHIVPDSLPGVVWGP